jgi:hypothetical protein
MINIKQFNGSKDISKSKEQIIKQVKEKSEKGKMKQC